MADLPTVLSPAGLIPLLPADLRVRLLTLVASTNPGYTATLPGSLIEDIASTDVGALSIMEQARIELVNSLTPFGANAFILNQLGQMLGVPIGAPSFTSVYVRFSTDPPAPGFIVPQGFIVSDGDFQYEVIDGGALDADGVSELLFTVATQAGIWTVAAGTVTQLVTQVPSSIVLSVVNPEAGVPGTDAETQTEYRARVLQANLAASQGMTRYLKTFLSRVSGVQPRLISAQQQDEGGWLIIAGGGDPYLVANAIFTSIFDISTLVGSTMRVAEISQANPAVVETFFNHGYSAGEAIEIASVNPSAYDGSFSVIAAPTEKTFSIGTPYDGQNIVSLTWSANEVTVVFTSPHGVTEGSDIVLVNSAPAAYNGTFTVIDVPTSTTLKFALTPDPGADTLQGQMLSGIANFDSTGLASYVSGGVLTPNNRNIEVTILDYPDAYVIPFVNPPQQDVTMTVTWNTNSPNFVAPAAVSQLAAPAIAAYVNSVAVGQPMNELELEDAFQAAVESVLPRALISRLVFAVAINGVGTSVTSGTKLIEGDPESFFFAVESAINVVQG